MLEPRQSRQPNTLRPRYHPDHLLTFLVVPLTGTHLCFVIYSSAEPGRTCFSHQRHRGPRFNSRASARPSPEFNLLRPSDYIPDLGTQIRPQIGGTTLQSRVPSFVHAGKKLETHITPHRPNHLESNPSSPRLASHRPAFAFALP